jgi:phospholipase C
MSSSSVLTKVRQHLTVGTSLLALLVNMAGPTPGVAQPRAEATPTASPIKHVIVIIGENRSFDHVFATYKPKNGETGLQSALLSKGIINEDGTAGPNYSLSAQYSAVDSTTVGAGTYAISPPEKTLYANIPPVVAGGPLNPYFSTVAEAKEIEPGQLWPSYYVDLTIGGTGLAPTLSPTRAFRMCSTCPRVPSSSLLRRSPTTIMPTARSTVSTRCGSRRIAVSRTRRPITLAAASTTCSHGWKSRLAPAATVRARAARSRRPTISGLVKALPRWNFSTCSRATLPYMKYLADNYTLSDNFHQSVMGGTMANHIEFGFADSIWYSDGNGNALTPPKHEIENPNPRPGTNNWYDADGYGEANGSGGGSYVNCADLSQPGVPAIVNYLESLPRPVNPNCEAGHYYILNNYNPGYNGDGTSSLQDLGSVYASRIFSSPHRRRPAGCKRLVEVLRRRLERVCRGSD